MTTVHQWLIEHPLSKDLIIGLILLIPALYSKEIRGFIETPPQKLGVWLRKARLSAAMYTQWQLRRAKNDGHFLLWKCVAAASWLTVTVCCMLVTIGMLLISVAWPNADTQALSNEHGFRIFCEVTIVAGAYISLFIVAMLGRFLRRLSSFADSDQVLTKKVQRLQQQLGMLVKVPSQVQTTDVLIGAAGMKEATSRFEPASDSVHDEPNNHTNAQRGSSVRHPKYGVGIILSREGVGNDAKLTVEFRHHGVKKLVEKFAQLEYM